MFETLDPRIIEVLREEGIFEPTKPQKQVFETILEGNHILLIAPTGTGKTEAALIPIFQNILKYKPNPISCLYITPLRALNRDLGERLENYAKKLGLNIGIRHGDTSAKERRLQSENPPDVLVTTPETVQILFTGKIIKQYLRNVKFVIIDEVHELVQDERGAQLSVALERLEALAGPFQRIGLSATVGSAEEVGKFISGNRDIIIREVAMPKIMELSLMSYNKEYREESELMGCETDYGSVLMEILNQVNSHKVSLIFVNTRTTAEDIAMRLYQYSPELPISVHHGSLSQEVRTTNEEKLKQGILKGLICTSSLELGIDIGSVDFVIQYNSPREVYRLIQRVGRSGHTLLGTSKGLIISENPVELEEGMSIVDLATKNFIEDTELRKEPMVVLANQIVSTAHSEKRLKVSDFYNLIKKGYLFKDLELQRFMDLINFLRSLRLIWTENGEFGTTKNALKYFYQNISLIPDEKSYRVIDVTNSKFIGILDERFVATQVEIGNSFVMKGMTWRVIDITEEKILVEGIHEISIPPLWIGEEIPVPFEVAENVARLRSRPIPPFVSESAREKILEWWNKVPVRLNQIFIEKIENTIVMENHFGTKVNLTLAELLSSLLSARIGESVNVNYSAYHISFQAAANVKEEEFKEVLLSLRSEYIESLLRKSIERSRLFKIVFFYIAKKFGVIAKDADFKKLRLDKLLNVYKNTIIFEETINKLFFDYLDLNNTRKVIDALNSGKIKAEICSFKQSAEFLVQRHSENFAPIKLTNAIVEKVKTRLLNEEVTMFCTSCKRSQTIKIKDLTRISCSYCGSVKVTMLQKYELNKKELFKKESLTEIEEKEVKRLMGISQMLRVFKRAGAMTLVAHGVGLETARRILRNYSDDEYTLVKNILESEIQYAKNRRFWD